MDDPGPSIELLESTHAFPGNYRIKAIGSTADDFTAAVIAAAESELAAASDLDASIRETAGGRHVAVTLDLAVQSAGQVQAVYARIREVPGLIFLF